MASATYTPAFKVLIFFQSSCKLCPFMFQYAPETNFSTIYCPHGTTAYQCCLIQCEYCFCHDTKPHSSLFSFRNISPTDDIDSLNFFLSVSPAINITPMYVKINSDPQCCFRCYKLVRVMYKNYVVLTWCFWTPVSYIMWIGY